MQKVWLETYKKFNIDANINMPAHDSSLLDFFEKNLQRHATHSAFCFMDKSISFAQLDECSLDFAKYLQSLNLAKGSRIALMMPNILQYPIAVLGIIRAGHILVNINPLYTTRELEHQLHDSGAEVLITVDRFVHVYQPLQDKIPLKQVIVSGIGDMLGGLKGLLVNFVLRYVRKEVPAWNLKKYISFKDALNTGATLSYQRPTLTLKDTAVLQYTGGTTGVSKGAELTHSNLIANMLQINNLFESRLGKDIVLHGEHFVCALPLYHIFSFTVSILCGLKLGANNILIANPRDLSSVVKEFRQYKPAFFPGINTLFNALAHHAEFQQLDHTNLQFCIGGGMSVLPATAKLWEELTGCVILEGYGLSETSPVVTFNPPNNPVFTATIGVPIPQTEVRLLDDDGNQVPQGEAGEIAVKGPQVMKGYWQRDDETLKVMTHDGYFRTGDIGVINEEGFIKIVDRKKDMILVSGFNVYPNELEEVIAQHPKVLEVAVIGVPDEKSGEVPKMFIVRKDSSLTSEEILDYAKEQLTGYKRPRYVEFLTELPKSNVGKILRKELRKPE